MSWTFHLCDAKTDTHLAEITNIVLSAKIEAKLNRPLQMTVEMPCDDPAVTTTWTDGDPYLFPGTRAIKAYRNGVLRAHTLVWTPSYSGDTESDWKVQVVSASPVIRLQYRNVFDATGHISWFDFPDPIDGGTLLSDAISNSNTYENNTVGGVTPPLLPLFVGSISSTTNVWSVLTNGPMTLGDLYSAMVDTGAVDFIEEPVDSSMGYTAGLMSKLHAYDIAGTDKSSWLHFDFGTGLKNVSACRRVLDMTSVGNRIIYECGPMVYKDHWLANITGTETSLSAQQTLQLASRKKFGTFAEITVHDTDTDVSVSDQLPYLHELWKEEVTLRVNPRELVYMTPAPAGDNFTQFAPFDDYGLGDIVAINVPSTFGPAISGAQQRIYGFTVDVDDLGVESVQELITSADAE